MSVMKVEWNSLIQTWEIASFLFVSNSSHYQIEFIKHVQLVICCHTERCLQLVPIQYDDASLNWHYQENSIVRQNLNRNKMLLS